MIRKILAALLACALFPIAAFAQTYDPNGNIHTTSSNLPIAPFTLSTACSTPLTPTSCASTSYKIIATAGGAELSLQISAINAGVFGAYVSNDGVNFVSSSVVLSNTAGLLTVGSSITAAGKYSANHSGSQYVAVVATTAPSSAVTITPYENAQSATLFGITSAVPLNIVPGGLGGDTSFSTLGTISTSGTAIPLVANQRGNAIDLPVGASCYFYIASAQAASAAAAAAIAKPLANPTTSTSELEATFNLTAGQQIYITQFTAGASGTYSTGIPTYRAI